MMGEYDFDKVVDRIGTSSLKYDFGMERMGREDLLPLWVADMDFELPKEILDDIHERVEHGIFGYTDPKVDYYRALNKWFSRRHGFVVNPDWVTVVPGVVYSLAVAIRAYTKIGDAVIIQEPVYYPFKETIELNKRVVVNNQLRNRDGRYEIDFEDFEEKIINNKVKLFLLCSPHNPVGRVWTEGELRKVGEICKKHDVIIVADEIHSDFIYEGNRHTSFITLADEFNEKLILATSPSKTFNIAGLQIANIIIPNGKLREKFKRENAAGGYSQANVLGLVAAKACYELGEKWVDELLEYLSGNIEYLRDYLEEKIPEVKMTKPEGTYLIWLDFSKLVDNYRDLKHLIVDEAGLWLDAGVIFGKETALYERINIACPRSTLEKALNKLYEAINNRKGR